MKWGWMLLGIGAVVVVWVFLIAPGHVVNAALSTAPGTGTFKVVDAATGRVFKSGFGTWAEANNYVGYLLSTGDTLYVRAVVA